jgi:hypothetical protein
MGKSKRKRATVRAKPYDAQPPPACLKTSGDAEMVAAGAPIVESTESRGSIEKRHHDELRKWKRHEDDVRRQMRKLSKKDQVQVQERKKLLVQLKQDKQAMEERHRSELTEKISRQTDEPADQPSSKSADDEQAAGASVKQS